MLLRNFFLLLLAAFAVSTASAQTHGIQLTWVDSPSCTVALGNGYNVYRGTVSGGETLIGTVFPTVPTCTATTYVDPASGLTSGTTYYYEMTTLEGGVESGFSNESSVKFLPPSPPTLSSLKEI